MIGSLKGIHRVVRKLADGSSVTYVYAWRGGPRLRSRPCTRKFLAEYKSAVENRAGPTPDSLASLIDMYKASSDFGKLRANTRREYLRHLAAIRKRFGKLKVSNLDDPRIRGVFKQWRDEIASTPRSADFRWSVLARICSFAKDRGLVAHNPCEKGGRLYVANRRDVLWTEKNLKLLKQTAHPSVWRVAAAALVTGQRLSDLLALTWRNIDGAALTLVQGKSKSRVKVPLIGELQEVLERGNRSYTHIFARSDGSPWTAESYGAAFRRTCKRAGICGLHFHDMRGTAITRMAKAGCTVPEIAALSGHALRTVHEMLDAHYLGDRAELAAHAVGKPS